MNSLELRKALIDLSPEKVGLFLQIHKKDGIMKKLDIIDKIAYYIDDNDTDALEDFFDIIITNKIFFFCKYPWYREPFQKYLKEHITEDKVIIYLDTYPMELIQAITDLNEFNIIDFLREHKNDGIMKKPGVCKDLSWYIMRDNKEVLEEFIDSIITNKIFYLCERPWYQEAFQKYLKEHITEDKVKNYLEIYPIELSKELRDLNESNVIEFLRKHKNDSIMQNSDVYEKLFGYIKSNDKDAIEAFFDSMITNKILFLSFYTWYKEEVSRYLNKYAEKDEVISFFETYPIINKYWGVNTVLYLNRARLSKQFRKLITEKPEEFLQCMLLNIAAIKKDSKLKQKIVELVLEFGESINHNELFVIILKHELNVFEPYILRYETLFQKFLENNATDEVVISFLFSSPIVPSLNKNFLQNLIRKHLKDVIPYEDLNYFPPKNLLGAVPLPENSSPMVKIKPNSKPIHLRFCMREQPDENPMYYYYKSNDESDFYCYFAQYRRLVEKLYNTYYMSYQKNAKAENESLYDFIGAILFSKNNFKNVVFNSDYSAVEIRQLLGALSSYNHPKKAEIKQFYTDFLTQESLKWNKICSWFINNRQNSELISERLATYKLTEETAYNFILKNKFLSKLQKTDLIGVLDYHFGKGLRLIDIIELLEEMCDKELTLDEILVEKDIEKGTFMKLYHRSAEQNPDLYSFIAEKLQKNKIRGFKKMIKLGYSILSSDASSFAEYNQKYPNHSIEEVLKALRPTELYEPIMIKAHSWPDYIPYEDEEELIESAIKK